MNPGKGSGFIRIEIWRCGSYSLWPQFWQSRDHVLLVSLFTPILFLYFSVGKNVTREKCHRLKQNCYERGTSSTETKLLRERYVIDWNKIVTREVRHRLKQNCYERGTSSIETKLLRERYVIDWNKTSESFCDVLLMLIGSRQYIVIFPLNYWIELNWIESNVIWNLILLYIVNGTLNQLYIYMCDIRDRPFNLRGGMFFCFVQNFFFGQHNI